MRTRIEGHAGWVEVTRDGLTVLAKGDPDLAARLTTALDSAEEGEELADVVTDELSADGVRRAPDFALVDTAAGRVLVRGTAVVRLVDGEGGTREVLAPRRGPWADEDLDEADEVVLVTGEAEPAAEPEQQPEPEPEPEPESEAPAAPATPPAAGGWAVPSVFGAPAAERPVLSVVPDPAQPIEEGRVVETPAPQGQDLVDEDVAGEGEADEGEDEELPSFDFLFGNTSHHRSSLVSALEDHEHQEQIDSGPVAAAGGFQPSQDRAGATLAPPSDDEEHAPVDPAPSGPSLGALPGGLPPMPGSVPAADPEQAPAAPSMPGPSYSTPPADGPALRVQAARDDAPGHEPGGGRPQFADGHLVGSRVLRAVPDEAGAGAGTGGEPPSSADQDPGIISAVPWGPGAPVGPSIGGLPGLPGGLPGLPVQDLGPAQPVDDREEPAADTGEVPAGPMVLAVRCSVGHHNPPHATRCRVCGQDLPTQQPEQTPRPALGLLRLSTGDVVTLDRGVLIGRAPRAATGASGARAPHLVRISSPDNEISRNHVEIVLDGWHVLVRDLGSTNGTTVALPGSSPVRVRPGDQQTIEPGTTITLADQVSMVFEVTG